LHKNETFRSNGSDMDRIRRGDRRLRDGMGRAMLDFAAALEGFASLGAVDGKGSAVSQALPNVLNK
jgi:hypothetical protein